MIAGCLLAAMFAIVGSLIWKDHRDHIAENKAYALYRKSLLAKVCYYAHTDGPLYCGEGCEHSVPHICEGNRCLERCNARCVAAAKFGYKITPDMAANMKTEKDEIPLSKSDIWREEFIRKAQKEGR